MPTISGERSAALCAEVLSVTVVVGALMVLKVMANEQMMNQSPSCTIIAFTTRNMHLKASGASITEDKC